MIHYPDYLNEIFEKLEKNGAKCIIIGGYIRDYFLNLDSKDIDVEVYNIASFEKLEELLKEFGSVNSFGKSFGVCKLHIKNLDIDFTLPRSDSKISTGHKGFEVIIDLDLDYKNAMSRRDFTINAIGYEVKSKKIIDPFHGLDDLKNKVLKAVDKNKFSDDPLRVLRGVQFCTRFDLTMDETLFSLCKEMVAKNILYELPKERIFEEIKKLLLKSSNPSIGLELLKKLGAFAYFCEFDSLMNKNWSEILYCVDEIAKQKISQNTKLVLMLAAICYKFDATTAMNFISKLTDEKKLIKNILPLTLENIKINYTNAELFKLASRVNIENFLILNRAMYKNLNQEVYLACGNIKERAKELHIFNKKATPLLKGRDILACGKPASKEYSKILETAYEAQMNEEFYSYDEAVKWLKNYLLV